MATLSITTPDKFRVIYPWMPKKSIYSGDIKRERYWTPSGFTESDALVTDRNSKIFLPDVDGVYQEVDQDKLSRTNRGLYVNGQIAALNVNGNNPQSGTGWSVVGGTKTNAPDDGIFKPIYFRDNASVSHRMITNLYDATAGVPFVVKFRYDGNCPDPSGHVRIVAENTTSGNNLSREAALGSLTGTSNAFGTLEIINQSALGVDVRYTPDQSGRVRVGVGPGRGQSKQIRILGIDVTNTPFIPDAWVSTGSPAPTLLASDIRAVQGIRPSNGQPEPVPGWEDAGLDDGFTVLLEFENKLIVGAGVRRVMALGTFGGQPLYLETSSTGSTFRISSPPTAFPGGSFGVTGGRSRCAVRIVGDSRTQAQEGSADIVHSVASSPYGEFRNLLIGSNAGFQPWKDWIYALHICKPLTDQEMLDWVNGVIPAIPTLNNIPLSTNTNPTISGTCDFNTTKIYVYVDGIQAGTALGDENDTWRCKLSLAPGTYQITARSESTIGKFSDYSEPITLVIADELSISGTPETYVQEGVEYSFTPTTTGGVPPYAYTLEDMDTMPDGMSIDPNTGELSGYPNPGIYEGITIQVEDQE